MVIDKEEHRAILTQLVEKAHFPGFMVESVVQLITSLRTATVAAAEPVQPDPTLTTARGGFPELQ